MYPTRLHTVGVQFYPFRLLHSTQSSLFPSENCSENYFIIYIAKRQLSPGQLALIRFLPV